MSTIERIRQHLQQLPAGQPVTPASLLGMGTRAAVDQALSRLVKSGAVTRVSRGMFVRPAESRFLGKVLPTPEIIAEAVARERGARLQVHGAEAARRFELSTQMPTQPVFDTTGPGKRLRVGKLEIVLKHTTARKLALAGRPAGEALSALWYLGRHQVTPATIAQVRRKLPAAEFDALSKAKASMPGWMATTFHRYEQSAIAHG